MHSLFGLELPTAVNVIIALAVVVALLVVVMWVLRRITATRLEAGRSRQPRLAVVDSAAVDNRRKLVIIRRDNVEHLLMIGGPTDVVVETSIVRGGAVAREPARETPAAVAAPVDTLPRAVPLPDPTPWPLQPEPAPAPAPTPIRPQRAARAAPDLRVASEPRVAPEPRLVTPEPRAVAQEPRVVAPEPRVVAQEPTAWPQHAEPAAPVAAAPQRADMLAGLANELARPAPQPAAAPVVAAVHVAPAPVAHAPVAHAPAAPVEAAADQNLADMAQRLEAALRRPMAQAQQPAAQPAPHVAAQPEPAQPAAAAPVAPRRVQPRPAQPQQAAAAPAPARGGAQPQYDSLEQEMASLLGRQGKT